MAKAQVIQHNYLIDCMSEEEFNTFDKQVIAKVLSLIHQDDMELKTVSINIDNLYERCYGSKLKVCPAKDRVLERLHDLKTKEIYVKKIDDINKYISFPWFSKFNYDNETRMADIKIHDYAIDYLINLERRFKSIGLDNYLDMDNIYAIRLMEIMSVVFNNVNHRKFEIGQLRKMIYAYGKYDKIYDFKKRVIEPAIKEVNKYTDFNLRYEQIKIGRKVKYIKFIKGEG